MTHRRATSLALIAVFMTPVLAAGGWWAFSKWNEPTAKLLGSHKAAARCIAYSPSGEWLASGDDTGHLSIFDARSREQAWCSATANRGRGVTCLAFSPNGTTLATGWENGQIRLWNAATREELEAPAPHPFKITGICFSADGKLLATTALDGKARLWDLENKKEFLSLDQKGAVFAVALSDVDNLMATAHPNNTARIWDIQSGTKKHEFSQLGYGEVLCIAFAPGGKLVAWGSSRSVAKVGDPATGEQLFVLEGHTGNVFGIAFSPDGRFLATAAYDDSIKLWDMATGQLRQTLTGHQGGANAVAFSPDGHWLAVATGDFSNAGTVKLWNVARLSK